MIVPSSSQSSNIGMIVGIVVAVVLLCCVAIILAIFFIIRRRRQNPSPAAGPIAVPMQVVDTSNIDRSDLFAPIPIDKFTNRSVLTFLAEQAPSDKSRKILDVMYEQVGERTPLPTPEQTSVGMQPENNPSKNRYSNVLPNDDSRVVIEGDSGDYINASWVPGFLEPKRYIATQGPLAATVADFWQMNWDYDVSVIVMLTRIVEENKVKCAQYWPNDLQTPSKFGKFEVTKSDEEVTKEITIRNLTVKVGAQTKNITHLHYTYWPGFYLKKKKKKNQC